MAHEPPVRQGDYRAARIGAAAALVAVLVVLLIVDALSAEYAIDGITVSVLLTTVSVLLGVEVRDSLLGGGRK